MNICHAAKRGIAAAIIAVLGFTANAVDADAFGNDGIDRRDPNFVTASLLIMSPGNELYSCAGHACIRLECPTFNLDYCFSYESEGVKDKVLKFLMGKLKMGMFAVPTTEYIEMGREEGRGVMQYRLNLPPDAKQRLWELLDKKVAEGPYLAYDYMERGCAQAAMSVLLEACRPNEIIVNPWPENYEKWARSEFLSAATMDYPWQQFILYTICGATMDDGMAKFRKVVIPRDLLDVLRIAKIGGQPLIDGEGVELLPVREGSGRKPFITPFGVSCFLLAIAFVNVFVNWRFVDCVLFLIQALLGLFLTYMVCFSNLTAIGWNWILVPFNVLPIIFWKWRQKWAMAFVGLLVLWEIGMVVYPHRMTDPAYLVLVGAYILFYLKFTNLTKMFRKG